MVFDFLSKMNRVINYDDNDKTMFYYLKRIEPSISLCISCGGCSATCPSGNFSSLNLHKIILCIRRGEKVYIANEIKQCMLCGKCILICPKNVNTRNIILNVISFLQSYKV